MKMNLIIIFLFSFLTYAENNTPIIKLNNVSGIKVIKENNIIPEQEINPVCNNIEFGQCIKGQSQYTSDIGADIITWNCVNNTLSVSCSKPVNYDSIDTEGWLHFANFGMKFYVDDSLWQNAVANMKVGIKVVNKKYGKFSFISATKLLNGNCIKIQQINSLEGISKIWHNENTGCNGTGLDYSVIYLKNYSPIYDYSIIKWDIKHCDSNTCSFTDNNDTKFYIL